MQCEGERVEGCECLYIRIRRQCIYQSKKAAYISVRGQQSTPTVLVYFSPEKDNKLLYQCWCISAQKRITSSCISAGVYQPRKGQQAPISVMVLDNRKGQQAACNSAGIFQKRNNNKVLLYLQVIQSGQSHIGKLI
jgi:hypothetical protein